MLKLKNINYEVFLIVASTTGQFMLLLHLHKRNYQTEFSITIKFRSTANFLRRSWMLQRQRSRSQTTAGTVSGFNW